MPLNLFGPVSSPFDEIVERATSEKQTCEDWELILEICDRVNRGDWQTAADCALSLRKRLNHRDPHVVMQTLCVIDSCVSNCGRCFKLQVCSKEFLAELKAKATCSNRIVADKTRQLIKRWAEEEDEGREDVDDNCMEPMKNLFSQLKIDGCSFPNPLEKNKTDVNVFRKEEEDLAKAIQLSLKEQRTQSSNVQRMNVIATEPAPTSRRTVKALYEFEAVEDNELSFNPGEFIALIDDSDPNWWRGSNHRGEGLFPASFVTKDLGFAVQRKTNDCSKKVEKVDDNLAAVASCQDTSKKNAEAAIDEAKLDRCIVMLQNVDPSEQCPDPTELIQLEKQCTAMGQLIEDELSIIDQEHNRLAEVNVRLMDAINSYHMAMNDLTSGHHQPTVFVPSSSSVLISQSTMATVQDGTVPVADINHPTDHPTAALSM